MVRYCREYIPDFATLARPLNPLTAKRQLWIWGPSEQQTFTSLKRCLQHASILLHPAPKLEYILDTDASANGLGAVLLQTRDGQQDVIAYYSKAILSGAKLLCDPPGTLTRSQDSQALWTLSLRQDVQVED